jgi:dimethylglycine catabolism B
MSSGFALPVLAERRAALETCGYCPKLCRAACPVSNAEPRDTITPWGKMTISWLAARGDVPVDTDHTRVAWACTGCFACRERCDHRNPVVETLTDVRAAARAAGVAPAESERVVERHPGRMSRLRLVLNDLQSMPEVDAISPIALLIGCGYLVEPEQARDVVSVAGALAGNVRLISGCCGAPLAWAGDREGAQRARAEVGAALAGVQTFIVADPGCALDLAALSPTPLVDLAARQLPRLRRLPDLQDGPPLRWHDPCQLGRGLGRYDEPRAVLTRLIGRAPEEFAERRERAACSGAGSLLPVTMPEVSRAIAARRLGDHEELGGGSVVTACGASRRRFLAAMPRRDARSVVDLFGLIARSLRG